MSDTVTATFGAQTMCPVPYHSMTLGPFSMTTEVRPGETPEAALERAYAACEAQARKVWTPTLAAFLSRAREAKGQGKL